MNDDDPVRFQHLERIAHRPHRHAGQFDKIGLADTRAHGHLGLEQGLKDAFIGQVGQQRCGITEFHEGSVICHLR